jgi:hypothetical protein
MMKMRTVEDAYQVALKAEENLARSKSNKTKERVQIEEEELSEKSSRSQ